MKYLLLLLGVLLAGGQTGCSVFLAQEGTVACPDGPPARADWPSRAEFEGGWWGTPRAEFVDVNGDLYAEYWHTVHAPRGRVAGMGEFCYDVVTLGLAEVVFTPRQIFRLLGADDYTHKVRVQWDEQGRAVRWMWRPLVELLEHGRETWVRGEVSNSERGTAVPRMGDRGIGGGA
jgi:hypothetical protein